MALPLAIAMAAVVAVAVVAVTIVAVVVAAIASAAIQVASHVADACCPSLSLSFVLLQEASSNTPKPSKECQFTSLLYCL